MSGYPEAPFGPEFERLVSATKADVLRAVDRQPRRGMPRRSAPWRRRWFTLGAVVLLAGGTVSAATAATGGPIRGQLRVGASQISAGAPPSGATAARITFTCISAGTNTVSVSVAEPADWRMGGTCDGWTRKTSTADVPVLAGADTVVTVDVADGILYAVDVEFVTYGPQGYPRNRAGQSYGSPGEFATDMPDLVLVPGQTFAGEWITGYVLRTDVERTDDTMSDDSRREFRARYPDGQPITLYASDGFTVLGTYRLFR